MLERDTVRLAKREILIQNYCMTAQKLLSEKDAISENKRNLYTIWEFEVLSFIWREAFLFQLFPCVPSTRNLS